MDSNKKLRRFKETKLGTRITQEKLEECFNGSIDGSFSKPCVLDYSQKRIFYPNEFFNKEGPSSLHWRDISALSLFPGDTMVIYRNIGVNGTNNFQGFFRKLLDKLTLDKVMRKESQRNPAPNDYLIDNTGIPINRFSLKRDSMGNSMIDIYYPQIEADAIEYAKAFGYGFSTISRTITHTLCE